MLGLITPMRAFWRQKIPFIKLQVLYMCECLLNVFISFSCSHETYTKGLVE